MIRNTWLLKIIWLENVMDVFLIHITQIYINVVIKESVHLLAVLSLASSSSRKKFRRYCFTSRSNWCWFLSYWERKLVFRVTVLASSDSFGLRTGFVLSVGAGSTLFLLVVEEDTEGDSIGELTDCSLLWSFFKCIVNLQYVNFFHFHTQTPYHKPYYSTDNNTVLSPWLRAGHSFHYLFSLSYLTRWFYN